MVCQVVTADQVSFKGFVKFHFKNSFRNLLGYARRKHREPCRRIVSVVVSLRVDKIYDRRVTWDRQLAEYTSEAHQQLSYEALRAVSLLTQKFSKG